MKRKHLHKKIQLLIDINDMLNKIEILKKYLNESLKMIYISNYF